MFRRCGLPAPSNPFPPPFLKEAHARPGQVCAFPIRHMRCLFRSFIPQPLDFLFVAEGASRSCPFLFPALPIRFCSRALIKTLRACKCRTSVTFPPAPLVVLFPPPPPAPFVHPNLTDSSGKQKQLITFFFLGDEWIPQLTFSTGSIFSLFP